MVCRSVLQCVAVCCSALQCVAVRCIVLQCVAVCCSVLQCVAVCCSVYEFNLRRARQRSLTLDIDAHYTSDTPHPLTHTLARSSNVQVCLQADMKMTIFFMKIQTI